MNRYEQRVKELGGQVLGAQHGRQPIHVPEEKLQEVEEQLNATLPPDYREFIRDYGNFYFPGATFPFGGEGWAVKEAASDMFFAISVEGESVAFDIVDWCYYGRFIIETWPHEWMPIAGDGGPTSVVLCIMGKNKGAVAYYANDMAPDSTIELYPVADSFDEFIRLINLRE